MKRFVFALSALFIVAMQITFGSGRYYPLTTVVVEVDRDAGMVVCEDYNGNRWVFAGAEDWVRDDCASLLMDNKGTEIIYDDEIVRAKYGGWSLSRG